jgi:shikimate dehydrogenase
MHNYGLIGKSLKHSFSEGYFAKKFADLGLNDFSYKNYEIDTLEALKDLISANHLLGLNITIPYKEEVLTLLDSIDPQAKQIGAVNCIAIRENKLFGYNTDVYGFSQSIKPFLDNRHERALILGTGGASKAVAFALKQIGVEVFFVSTKPNPSNPNTFGYADLNAAIFNAFKLIVNCSPLGTFPAIDEAPALPYEFLTADHFVYDLVYNPAETKLLRLAKEKGCMTMNGYSMLQLQAEKSWEIWQSF